MKKLRIKKELGIWYYKKIMDLSLDAPIYELYNEDEEFVATFGAYYQMKRAIEYGDIEEYIRCFG